MARFLVARLGVEVGKCVERGRLDLAKDGGTASEKWRDSVDVGQRLGLLVEDAFDGGGIETAKVLDPGGGDTKSVFAEAVAQTQQGADVDGREGLHAALEAIDQRSEVGKAT